MRYTKIKQIILLFGLMMPTIWCSAIDTNFTDGHSHINVKESHVQSIPRGSSIHASIDGHCLTISFSESIGQVAVEVSSVSGVVLRNEATHTPEGLLYYIPLAGDYIVTFTLANGDEYYGEFTVTD